MSNRLLFPMWVVNLYIGLGLILSFIGPLGYRNYNYLPVLTLISSVLAFFSIGYFLGIRHRFRQQHAYSRRALEVFFAKIFRLSLWVSVICLTFIFIKTVSTTGLNLNIFESGNAYVESYDGYTRNSGNYSVVFLASTLCEPFTFLVTIWGFYNYRELSRLHKAFLLYSVLGTILIFTIGGGKQKQFGDLAIYLITVFTVVMAQKNRLRISFLLKCIALITAAVTVFCILLSSRYDASGINASNLGTHLHPLIYVKEDNFIFKIFGDFVGFPVAIFSGYLSQGYYGLSLSLEQQFTWTAFAGSSYSVSVILNRFFGLPFMFEQTYPHLVGLSTGWGETKWHTVYSWLASDLTFPGTVFFSGFIGYIYGTAWREAVVLRNPLSVLIFCLLTLGAVYAPANNQLMNSPGALLTLLFCFSLYYWLRSGFNYEACRSREVDS